jgi:hypothetical protein
MPVDTIVESAPIHVMYVAVDKSKPISEQAPQAVDELEAAMPSLQGSKFFGVVVEDEYRACVRVGSGDALDTLKYSTFTIPGGRYVHRGLIDWDHKIELIGEAVDELTSRADYDSSRYVIEHYRSHTEIVIRVPVT